MADIDAENVPVEDLIPHLDLFDPQHRNRLWEALAHARASSCPVRPGSFFRRSSQRILG